MHRNKRSAQTAPLHQIGLIARPDPVPGPPRDRIEQSLIGETDRAQYGREASVSTAAASNDFRRLLDARLVIQGGRGRSTRYLASDELRRQVDAATG